MSFKKFIPGIAWFFLVLILICLPGDKLPEADNWMTAVFFDKWVHTGLFSVMAFLFMYPVRGSASLSAKQVIHFVWKVALSVSIWGLATEYIQKFFIPGRDFDLADWGADSFGALIALGIFRWKFLNAGKIKTPN